MNTGITLPTMRLFSTAELAGTRAAMTRRVDLVSTGGMPIYGPDVDGQPDERVSLLLVDELAVVRINYIKCFFDHDECLYLKKFEHNADFREEQTYYFVSQAPRLILDPGRPGLRAVEISAHFLETGHVVVSGVVRKLRQELLAAHGLINVRSSEAQQLGHQLEAMRGSLTWRASRALLDPLDRLLGPRTLGLVSGLLRRNGTKPIGLSDASYREWVRLHDTLSEEDRQAMRERVETMAYRPRISIVMPVYNTPEDYLRQAIESVRWQIYPRWELCISDDASTKPHVRQVLEEYAAADSRIKVDYRQENGHISRSSNSALELAGGEFVALLDHDDLLTEHALYLVAEELNQNPELDFVYSDEDKIDLQGRRFAPHFKPDWNPDMLLSQNYVCHLAVLRRTLLQEAGGFREGLEGSQDYDLFLRASRLTVPARIRHIPFVLYHWRAIEGSTALNMNFKKYCIEASRRAVDEHCEALGMRGRAVAGEPACINRVRFDLSDGPLVSVIIPTRNKAELLVPLVEDLLLRTSYKNLEILIVDHESDEPELLDFYEHCRDNPALRVLPFSGQFNYSAMNNLAAAQAQGDLLLFLNNDMRVLHPDWLEEMVGHGLRAEIGAVGAKLLYPDETIQHCGLILGIKEGVAESQFQGLPAHVVGYVGRTHTLQNVSAVTAACMLLRRTIFIESSGFDEINLPVAFNDVDLCLRLGQLGYRILLTPFARLRHLESASRGSDHTSANFSRFRRELDYMLCRWSRELAYDPAYNPNLSLLGADYAPAFPPRAHKPWQENAANSDR
ncbi:putative glycosyltransferase [Desulfocurvibacter africanus PCS]|uniref:Putative glycosyltransferase n=1 Tax=Desulfocurvibacter africanus PCS TaxID=1262666 RepID=M5PSK9_DESAF|nr:glycosyltransferase [Desulfocurvibacter africanus]EMG37104.1 putative glycosyltransferase [Desulfocurvibacter africanus PCS]